MLVGCARLVGLGASARIGGRLGRVVDPFRRGTKRPIESSSQME